MILTTDIKTGKIQLNGQTMPGIFQNLTVNGELIIDKNSSAGSNKVRKIMRGFGDNRISIQLSLIDKNNLTGLFTGNSSIYKQLEELENLFRTVNNTKPMCFTINHEHLNARKISKVIFRGLSSSESNSSEKIDVVLQFEEFIEAEYNETSKN
ncbi:MAG: hypothetical protein ACRC9L_02080 [Brevinema sp.]